jgi:hypothetical protein
VGTIDDIPTAWGSFGGYFNNDLPYAITIDEHGMIIVAGTTVSDDGANVHFIANADRTALLQVKTHFGINMEYDDAYDENPYGTGYTGTKWFHSKYTTTNEAAATIAVTFAYDATGDDNMVDAMYTDYINPLVNENVIDETTAYAYSDFTAFYTEDLYANGMTVVDKTELFMFTGESNSWQLPQHCFGIPTYVDKDETVTMAIGGLAATLNGDNSLNFIDGTIS